MPEFGIKGEKLKGPVCTSSGSFTSFFFILHKICHQKTKILRSNAHDNDGQGKKSELHLTAPCNSKTTLSTCNVIRIGITWNICKKKKTENKNKTTSCFCDSKLTYFKSHVQDFRFVMVTFHIGGEMNEPKTVTVS